MKLKDLCEFKTNFEGADFWIKRKGGVDTIGKPTKTFSSDDIGVKVTRTDLVLPDFLFYYFLYMQSSGIFSKLADKSTSVLTNHHAFYKQISIKDIENIPVSFQ